MNVDIPFIAEYATSGKSSCKTCKNNIVKDAFRIGVMVQSPDFDAKIPTWHHFNCFIKEVKFTKVEDIANFDNLRWEDQNKIKEAIGKTNESKTRSSKGGKAKNLYFSIEYAKSSRAACKVCGEKIQKGVIRISKLITVSPKAHRFGPISGWHHVDCFVKMRLELPFLDSVDKIPGFENLSDEDKKEVKEKIGTLGVKRKSDIDGNVYVPAKKMTKEEATLKAQSDLMFDMRDKLKQLNKSELISLLEYNNQHISTGEYRLRDNLSDLLIFGAIETCPECKTSTPRFKFDAYRCSGNLTEWTKCQFVTRCPERKPFKIPEELREKYEFLQEYKYVKRDRILPTKSEPSSSNSVPKGYLQGYIVAICGKFEPSKSALEKKVLELGGEVSAKVGPSVHFIISTEEEVKKNSKPVIKASELNTHVVSAKFLEDVQSGSSVVVAIQENKLADWGGDPILKFGVKQEYKLKSQAASNSSSSTKSSTMKIPVKRGAAVDPESGMEKRCHVYQKKDTVYNVVLGLVDLARGSNTYYKLQLLESNKGSRYYVFRSWGRVGTTIGSNKLENYDTLDEAMKQFAFFYKNKTGNEWNNHKNFVKKPGYMYPLDIDYGQEGDHMKDLKPGDNSKLPKAVQELVCLIFDIEAMKKTMVEFEIDLKKMPLGKLSKKQIESAYSVLNEAQQILLTGSNATKILDASNRFYTLIPHDFGMKQPPLLDNEELIKSKIEMLDSLLEIEFAYKLLQGDGLVSTKDPVDEHYEKLNTDIETLEETSDEYVTISTYLKNTHSGTHNLYKLHLNRVFKINRHGESQRYQKFKDLHNKKLLWHGSRLTNYVGILSQGLRIAPPGAPASGYMFGKGIYFADMVSKSANYCFTNKKNPRGLLLLCEVALGNMYERTTSQFINKLPAGKHSTKGLGITVPDPNDKTFLGDVEVPYGKPTKSNILNSLLRHNEYIVYNINQVNIKYLLDVKFKWKY